MSLRLIITIGIIFVVAFVGVWVVNMRSYFPQPEAYQSDVNLADYYATEELVGLPAHWDGKTLVDDNGNIYATPDWFVKYFPDKHLSGFLSGSDIETVRRAARRAEAKDAWRKLRLIVLDMPKAKGDFEERLQELKKAANISPYIKIAHWQKLRDENDLTRRMQEAKQGADNDKTGGGIILRLKNSPYVAGDNDFLIAKPYQEGTAQVVAINIGETGNMSSLDVIDKNGGGFIISGGFSGDIRRTPPVKGSYLAYKYNGYTETGKPQYPIFLQALDNPPRWAQKRIFGVIYPHHLTWVFLIVMLILALSDAFSSRTKGVVMDFKSAIVSVGLLGTFIGIWWGLYNFNSANITGSVPALLDGLKLSFVTSIAGIGLSVFLNVIQTASGRQDSQDLSALSADIKRLATALEKLQAENDNKHQPPHE